MWSSCEVDEEGDTASRILPYYTTVAATCPLPTASSPPEFARAVRPRHSETVALFSKHPGVKLSHSPEQTSHL